MMIDGAYTLELYCDNRETEHDWAKFPYEYVGERGTDCRRRARRDGWLFKRNGKVFCPKCSGKGKPEEE